MSVKNFEFLPTLLNRANDTSVSGFTDIRTGQDMPMGGTLLGDAINLQGHEAFANCDPTVAILYEGQYRRIYVDPNATAANIGVGRAAFVAPGTFVRDVRLVTSGSGQTPGTYLIAANGGGGTGASILVTVATTGTASAVLVSQGTGYTGIPTFTLTGAGGTAATFQAIMDYNTFKVTSADNPSGNPAAPRGVFLNAITPGNYGWIQESGIASLYVGNGAVAGPSLTPQNNGTFSATAAPNANGWAQVATALDVVTANGLCRGILTLAGWQG